jgi:hypothetical protein
VKVRNRRVTRHEEDATEQAGWLFADSFLALMIIFLATISFVPDLKNVEGTTKIYTEALTLTYDSYDPDRVQADIVDFLNKKNFALSSKVVFARIIGGAPEIQDDTNGYLLALKFSLDLQRDQVLYFQETRFDIQSSTLVANKSVLMQLTFMPRG